MSSSNAAKAMNENRQDIRYTANENFTCTLVCKLTNKHLKIRPVDVSKRGMGFMVDEMLPNGSLFQLVVEGFQVNAEVAFCINHLGIDNLYRAGLFSRDATVDLTEIFRRLGFALSPQL